MGLIERWRRGRNRTDLQELHPLAPDDPRVIMMEIVLRVAKDMGDRPLLGAAVTPGNIRSYITAREGEGKSGCAALSDAELWRRARERAVSMGTDDQKVFVGARKLWLTIMPIAPERILIMLRDRHESDATASGDS